MGKKKFLRKDENAQPLVPPTTYADYKPVFSFEYLDERSLANPKQNSSLYKDLLVRLKKLSELGWREIYKTQRHGFGVEKIPIKQFKPKMPSTITPEMEDLMVFRADGMNHVFAGFKREKVFFIVFIESDFGNLYNH